MAVSKPTARVKKAASSKVVRGKHAGNALREVRIWIPDLSPRRLRAEAHRQSRNVAESAAEREDQKFVESLSTPE